MRFKKFWNVHEDDLLVRLLHADQAPNEIFLEHVQHLHIVALGFDLSTRTCG